MVNINVTEGKFKKGQLISVEYFHDSEGLYKLLNLPPYKTKAICLGKIIKYNTQRQLNRQLIRNIDYGHLTYSFIAHKCFLVSDEKYILVGFGKYPPLI